MNQFQCPHCGAQLAVPDEQMGQQVRCYNCQGSVATPLPAPGGSSPAGPSQVPAWAPAAHVGADQQRHRGKAIASLILGIIGLLAWLLPCIGLPVVITGLVLGIIARKSSARGMAIAGIILGVIGLALAIINAAVGAYLGATGQHPLIPFR